MISVVSEIRKLLAAAALAVPSAFGAVEAAAPLATFPPSAAYGDYAVGATIGFAVDNRQRFDPWNTAYTSDAYRAMLRKVEASGQPRTVIFHLWYPAEADRSGSRLAGPRSPWPAVSGQRAKMGDYFFNDEQFAVPVLRSSVLFPATHERLHFKGGGTLAGLSGGAGQEAFETIGRRYFAAPRGAYLDAPPASAPPSTSAPPSAAGGISHRHPVPRARRQLQPVELSRRVPGLAWLRRRRAELHLRQRSPARIPRSRFRVRPRGPGRRSAGGIRADHGRAEGHSELLPLHVRRRVPRRLQSGADESHSGRRAARHHDDAEPVSPARGRRGAADPHGEAAGRGRSRLRSGAELDGRDLGRARAVRPCLPDGSAARSDWPAIPSAR